MKPDGVNGSVPAQQAQQPSLVERIDNVNVSNANQLSETLAGLTNEANQEIQKAFEDKRITQKESRSLNFLMSKFCSLNGRIKTEIKTAGEKIKNTYEQLSKNLDNTIERLTKASNGNNPDEVALEPQETDAEQQKTNNIPSEKEFLSSVSADIKDAYLRIVNPENYGGHGGSLSVAQKSPNAKVGGLTGILREYGNVLTEGQTVFLEREIAKWKEIAKTEQNEQEEGTNETLYQGQTTYGSHFYDNPENGKKLAETMHNVYTTEGLTLANARKVIGLDEE